MGYLNNCEFDEVTEELHGLLTGFDCKQEPLIEKFFREECGYEADSEGYKEQD